MAIRICGVDDIKPGRALRVKIGDHPIAIIKSPNGEFHALDDKCSHGETGAPLTLPAFEPVGVYEVLVENGEVFIEYEQA